MDVAVIEQLERLADRGLDEQRHRVNVYGIAGSVIAAAASAMVTQGLSDGSDPTWLRVSSLVAAIGTLLVAVSVLRSAEVYDVNPITETVHATDNLLTANTHVERLLNEKLLCYEVNESKLAAVKEQFHAAIVVGTVTAVLGGIMLIH